MKKSFYAKNGEVAFLNHRLGDLSVTYVLYSILYSVEIGFLFTNTTN